MPIGTAVHERTLALAGSLNYREWSGYYAVSAYEAHHDHEYNAIRNASALIDVSPLYKYLVRGRDAVKLVDRVITRDAQRETVFKAAADFKLFKYSKRIKEKKSKICFSCNRGQHCSGRRKGKVANINLVLGYANYYKESHGYFAFIYRLFSWPKTGLEICIKLFIK
jgi:hypothetical protein